MSFLSHYGLFLLEVLTVFAVIAFFIVLIRALKSAQAEENRKGKIQLQVLNQKYIEMSHACLAVLEGEKKFKKIQKETEKEKKSQLTRGYSRPRVFVLQFNGDLRASQVAHLRECISALLGVATAADEVILRLESPGGLVSAYGLAASQLERLKKEKIPLTVAVDKVAASGGYMMAAVADKIIAAPFAVIGSIGVLMQLPNFHRFLKQHHIDFEQLSAGEYKRTLSVLGENTKKGREKTRADLENIHALFKSFLAKNRPQLDLDKVATGEYWLAEQAINLSLIDHIQTSDDYLLSRMKTHDLFQINYVYKEKMTHRLGKVKTYLETAFLGGQNF